MHGNYYFKYKMVAKPVASCAYILRTAPNILISILPGSNVQPLRIKTI
jgi:hypothetical protein